MFDVFYIGKKPNLFVHEQPALDIKQAQVLSKTRFFWVVNYLVDYKDFDFLWEPSPWESNQMHVWPSQWQKDSGTYLIPKNGYSETNYKSYPKLYRKNDCPVFFIDHNNDESQSIYKQIQNKTKIEKSVRFFDNYFDILKRIARNARNFEYIWICSSICDYSNFDFNWHPETWQNTMLHVFPSNEQKFGDTFYMHVPSFLERMDKVELLEWYKCNFNLDQLVTRLLPPVINHNFDSHATAIKQNQFNGPVAVYSNSGETTEIPAINLWRPKTRTIVPLTDRGSKVVVPRDAVSEIKTQLYDYPYIDKSNRNTKDSPLDIIFISNGESNAEQNWQHLKSVTKNLQNRVVRVDGINGRVAAYHAALNNSETPWAFCVFAKLEVNSKFDWSWQPDCLQEAKHYIFHAKNPINGLVYGHMAMIAYNKKLVLANNGLGLDFTLDQPHETVPLLSGVARYDNDPWMTWRTAFREVVKLLHMPADIERDFRLKMWKSAGNGTLAKWSQKGSLDAEEYFTQVKGNFDALKKTYEWSWLNDYFLERYSLTLATT